MQRVIYRYRDTYFNTVCWDLLLLIHWGRVTHIWVGKLTIIGSDNGLDGAKPLSEPMLEHCYLAPLGTNFFSAMLIEIQTFLLKTISSATCQLCRGLNVLRLEIPPWHDFYVTAGFYPIRGDVRGRLLPSWGLAQHVSRGRKWVITKALPIFPSTVMLCCHSNVKMVFAYWSVMLLITIILCLAFYLYFNLCDLHLYRVLWVCTGGFYQVPVKCNAQDRFLPETCKHYLIDRKCKILLTVIHTDKDSSTEITLRFMWLT